MSVADDRSICFCVFSTSLLAAAVALAAFSWAACSCRSCLSAESTACLGLSQVGGGGVMRERGDGLEAHWAVFTDAQVLGESSRGV